MRTLVIPPEALEQIALGAVLAISISGGKDSQALLEAIVAYLRANNLPNRVFAIHADLGRTEWEQTPAFVDAQCERLGIELIVVRREREGVEMDLIDRIEQRKAQLEEKGRDEPFFPSWKVRYCTSDLKTDPIDAFLRQFDRIISVEGICWHESPARAQKPRWKVRKGLATKKRAAFTWNAIIDWSIADVFIGCGQTLHSWLAAFDYYCETGLICDSWTMHPAYAMGNTRLSCAICILGSVGDFLNGILHNPKLADKIESLEESGWTFKESMSIKQGRERLQNLIEAKQHQAAMRLAILKIIAKSENHQYEIF